MTAILPISALAYKTNPVGGDCYMIPDALAVSAYWARRYTDSMDAGLRLLSEGKLPESERGRVLANLRFAFEKLPRV